MLQLINAKENPAAFQNLFNLYIHELSRYNSWLGTQLDENGVYLAESVQNYLTSDIFESYCILVQNFPIGFAVFSSEKEENQWYHDVEEIFLIHTSRHQGIAEQICIDFWKRNIGIGTLHVLPENEPAIRFWERLLKQCGFQYSKERKDGMLVYHFPLSK